MPKLSARLSMRSIFCSVSLKRKSLNLLPGYAKHLLNFLVGFHHYLLTMPSSRRTFSEGGVMA